MRKTIVLGLVLSGLSLAACSPSPNGTPREPGPAATMTATVTATASPPPQVTAPPAPVTKTETTTIAPPPVSPPTRTREASGLSDAQIRTDAANAFDVVNTYWENLFATWKDPQGYPIFWQRPALYRGDGFYDSTRGEDFFCAGDPLGPDNASFCGSVASGTGTLEWDMDLFRSQEAGYGNAPIYWTIAHEVGHAAQTRFRHDNQGGAAPPMGDTVHSEQQADCLSGATLAKAEQDGYVNAEPGAVDEIISFISGMESGGDHGSSAARKHAFQHGHDTGDVESCLYNRGVPPPGLFG